MNDTIKNALSRAQQHFRPPVAAEQRQEAVQAAQQAHGEADAALLKLSGQLVRLELHDQAKRVQELMHELHVLNRTIR